MATPSEMPVTAHWMMRSIAALARLARGLTSSRAATFALAISIAVALLAPLGPLTANRFHRDEAIYSSWGLDIASGRDLLVSGSPVDKPPLFLYVQALSFVLFGPTEAAARLPSLIASLASVALIYALGRSLYGQGVGLLAAFLLAASPYAILFAPTAFTDPLMVTWVLAGCLAVVRGRWGWAGIGLGLAAMTKQQGIFFAPLAIGLGQVTNRKLQIPSLQSPLLTFTVGWLAMLGLALGWDVARARQPGFWVQSLTSYGGLPLDSMTIWKRLLGFGDMLGYGTGSPALNGILLAGLPLLLTVDVLALSGSRRASPGPNDGEANHKGRSVFSVLSALSAAQIPALGTSPSHARKDTSPAWADLVLLAFGLAFLAGHSVVVFQVWDRYLLGLIPLLALLLARVLTLPWRLATSLSTSPIRAFLCFLFVMSTLTTTLRPIQDAAASRFPIGGDHGAYQGIEQVADYLRTVPADTTLYHRWLGWHWRFYLWGSPYDFRAWTSPADLASQAAARPGARRYIVFPSWASPTEARLALAAAGLGLHEMQRTFRSDGSVSFIVYRIEEVR